MHFNMDLPGLEDVIVTKQENRGDLFYIFCEMERQLHQCPNCANWTDRIHDYREQKINHLKIFERRGTLIYKKRRYACNECGKRFYENNNIVERYQRNSIEFNQSLGFRLITGSSFTDTAHLFDISPSTALRRFDKISDSMLGQVDELPSVISIDEYKGDTDAGKYQLIIVDPVERKPLDILPNRSKKELIRYLRKKGSNVKVVVMDMSPSFKAAVHAVLGKPIIIADRFHFVRYIHWAMDKVRKRVQKEFSDYDRKRIKRKRYVLHKPSNQLNDWQLWNLQRYIGMNETLKKAHELKESFREWFIYAKDQGAKHPGKVRNALMDFYQLVKNSGIPEFLEAIETFQNWQTEILNSFAFDLHNGFIEGVNNQTKVIKRNAFGFKSYKRFRLKILLHHQYKEYAKNVG